MGQMRYMNGTAKIMSKLQTIDGIAKARAVPYDELVQAYVHDLYLLGSTPFVMFILSDEPPSSVVVGKPNPTARLKPDSSSGRSDQSPSQEFLDGFLSSKFYKVAAHPTLYGNAPDLSQAGPQEWGPWRRIRPGTQVVMASCKLVTSLKAGPRLLATYDLIPIIKLPHNYDHLQGLTTVADLKPELGGQGPRPSTLGGPWWLDLTVTGLDPVEVVPKDSGPEPRARVHCDETSGNGKATIELLCDQVVLSKALSVDSRVLLFCPEVVASTPALVLHVVFDSVMMLIQPAVSRAHPPPKASNSPSNSALRAIPPPPGPGQVGQAHQLSQTPGKAESVRRFHHYHNYPDRLGLNRLHDSMRSISFYGRVVGMGVNEPVTDNGKRLDRVSLHLVDSSGSRWVTLWGTNLVTSALRLREGQYILAQSFYTLVNDAGELFVNGSDEFASTIVSVAPLVGVLTSPSLYSNTNIDTLLDNPTNPNVLVRAKIASLDPFIEQVHARCGRGRSEPAPRRQEPTAAPAQQAAQPPPPAAPTDNDTVMDDVFDIGDDFDALMASVPVCGWCGEEYSGRPAWRGALVLKQDLFGELPVQVAGANVFEFLLSKEAADWNLLSGTAQQALLAEVLSRDSIYIWSLVLTPDKKTWRVDCVSEDNPNAAALVVEESQFESALE